MTYRQRRRLSSRKSWSTILAVLLSTLAGAFAFGPSSTVAGGPSVAEHNTDARTTGNPTSVRPDSFDPSLNLGGLADAGASLDAEEYGLAPWTGNVQSVTTGAFSLPVSVERMRDGRTRAPPRS